MWPFKEKMTVDYLAGIVASAIEENISVYFDAIETHAGSNVSSDIFDSLSSDLWALDLALLGLIITKTKVPKDAGADLIAMILVAYSPFKKKGLYSERALYYSTSIFKDRTENLSNLAKAFVSASGIEFKTEHPPEVSRDTLEQVLSIAITGSYLGLFGLVDEAAKKYKIIR